MQTTHSTSPHDRHNGPYALRRSVNIVFLLLARQNKQASFALTQTLSSQVLLQLTSFSSFSLGKVNKFPLHSDAQFAGSSSVNFVFLLLARQSKQVCFALTRASVPAHVEMMGFLGIGQVMCKMEIYL